MVENLIRETALRFLNLLGEQSEQLKDVLTDLDNIEIIEEAIELLTDETLRNFDEYVYSISSDDPEDQ